MSKNRSAFVGQQPFTRTSYLAIVPMRPITNPFAVDNWLKQKPRKKLKKATVRPQSENDLEVVEKESRGEGEGDAAEEEQEEEEEEEEEACIATPVEASAEEEAAAVASTIGLPDPEYDSAIESDCESDLDFW